MQYCQFFIRLHFMHFLYQNKGSWSPFKAKKEWIIKNQLGRRNLTEQEASYYRGKLYESRKRQGERVDLTCGKNFHKLKTSDIIGKEYGVTDRTVKNDAEFSKAVDKVAEEVGEEAKRYILHVGKTNTTPINLKQA